MISFGPKCTNEAAATLVHFGPAPRRVLNRYHRTNNTLVLKYICIYIQQKRNAFPFNKKNISGFTSSTVDLIAVNGTQYGPYGLYAFGPPGFVTAIGHKGTPLAS